MAASLPEESFISQIWSLIEQMLYNTKPNWTSFKTSWIKLTKELAVAQTLTSPKVETSGSQETDAGEEKTDPTSDGGSAAQPITKIILTIEAGSTSKTVADRLERSGVIDSAKEFENYLLDKGLSGRIQIGEHEVDTTMDLETIARIITNTKNR